VTEYKLDPLLWFNAREVYVLPPHFVVAKTPLSTESKEWIMNKTSGRFCITRNTEPHFTDEYVPAFENSAEAVMYELTWS